ncbi:HAD family hydrolase [soil metagenome]
MKQTDKVQSTNNNSSNIKAMIFDMDGTVINSNKKDFEAWNKIMEEQNVNIDYQEYTQLLGAKSSEIFKKYVDLSEEEIETLIENREKAFKKIVEEDGLEAMPNIENVLKQISEMGIPIALATGAQREKLDYMMDIVKVKDYFDFIITADDVEKGKPDPEIFLKAVKKLKVKPEEVIVWEDSNLGVQAAKNGNFKCIAITTTNGDKEGLEEADLIIDSFENINVQDILKKFSKIDY